jgi:hypothetical protein
LNACTRSLLRRRADCASRRAWSRIRWRSALSIRQVTWSDLTRTRVSDAAERAASLDEIIERIHPEVDDAGEAHQQPPLAAVLAAAHRDVVGHAAVEGGLHRDARSTTPSKGRCAPPPPIR